MRGIDVSENNGAIDWEAVRADGIEFAIIRLGWGNKHLDSRFYDNINGAIDAGLKVGIYYYSEAVTKEEAIAEAEYCTYVLKDGGITMDTLEMGVWFDEEQDDWKKNHGLNDGETITEICKAFINTMEDHYYNCGLYANFDYLFNLIDMSRLPGIKVWCAQYNDTCDYDGASIWQYTDSYTINGAPFDGDIAY